MFETGTRLGQAQFEQAFSEKKRGVRGPCPLPEPGDADLGQIEHLSHLSVRKQPDGYDYDKGSNQEEEEGFVAAVSEMVQDGVLTVAEAGEVMTGLGVRQSMTEKYFS